VTIQPLWERAAAAAGAETTDEIHRARINAGSSGNRIEALAESTLGRRLDQRTAAFGVADRGHDEAALYAREDAVTRCESRA
jgi:hypothetical protein